MIELKPCPFCGAEPRWCGEGNEDPALDHHCHQIHCDGCGVQFDADTFDVKNAETIDEVKEVIAKSWNMRIEE